MDDKFRDLLESLPEKPQRSRLEACAELIHELRRRGRTYRDIAHILGEQCQLPVAASTVLRFMRARARQRRKQSQRQLVKAVQPKQVGPIAMKERMTRMNTETTEKIRQRIEELKRRPVPVQESSKEFHYNPDEPLRLRPRSEKDRSEQ